MILNYNKFYSLNDAILLLKKNIKYKFDESVDISVHLSINKKKYNKLFKNFVKLPFGNGRKNVIAVLSSGKDALEAKKNGADFVGLNSLIDKIKSDGVFFDFIITSSRNFSLLNPFLKKLGPKGLIPNKEFGTLTENIVDSLNNIRSGLIQYKSDKFGIINSSIGRLSFSFDKIKLNFIAFINSLEKKNICFLNNKIFSKILLSSTMGKSININLNTIYL